VRLLEPEYQSDRARRKVCIGGAVRDDDRKWADDPGGAQRRRLPQRDEAEEADERAQ
jgi:hypothetical protein